MKTFRKPQSVMWHIHGAAYFHRIHPYECSWQWQLSDLPRICRIADRIITPIFHNDFP